MTAGQGGVPGTYAHKGRIVAFGGRLLSVSAMAHAMPADVAAKLRDMPGNMVLRVFSLFSIVCASLAVPIPANGCYLCLHPFHQPRTLLVLRRNV